MRTEFIWMILSCCETLRVCCKRRHKKSDAAVASVGRHSCRKQVIDCRDYSNPTHTLRSAANNTADLSPAGQHHEPADCYEQQRARFGCGVVMQQFAVFTNDKQLVAIGRKCDPFRL